jgi:hypothetical protein
VTRKLVSHLQSKVVRANSTPAYEDIARFAVFYTKSREGRGKDGVMNYDTILHGMISIKKALTFRHEDLSLGPHGASKIQAAINTLLQQGELTREFTRSLEPIGAVVVRRLVIGLLNNAITKGMTS